MNALGKYIQSTKTELRYVAWPTQLQTIVYTALVIGVSIVVALYIGFFDFFFTRGLEEFIQKLGGRAPIEAPLEVPADVDFNIAPGTDIAPQLEVTPATNEVPQQ